MSDIVVVDIETTGLDSAYSTLRLVGYYDGEAYHSSAIVDPKHLVGKVQVYHNGYFDVLFTKNKGKYGLEIGHDTMLMASLLPLPIKEGEESPDMEESLALDALCKVYLGIDTWKSDCTLMDEEELIAYNKNDCVYTYQLYHVLKAKLIEHGLWEYYLKLLPVYKLLIETTRNGVKIDKEALHKLLITLQDEVLVLESGVRDVHREVLSKVEGILGHMLTCKVKKPKQDQRYVHCETGKKITKAKWLKLGDEQNDYSEAFIANPLKERKYQDKIDALLTEPPKLNFNSPAQLAILFRELGLELKDKHGKETTSFKQLLWHKDKHPIIKDLIELRTTVKLIQFLDKWKHMMRRSKLHPIFLLTKVITGRLSCKEPNLQQVPRDKRLRALFVPEEPDNVFVILDYKQIEVVLTAHMSKDPRLIGIITKGGDIYGTVAKQLFNLDCDPNDAKKLYPDKRFIAKTITLGIIYGMRESTLIKTLKDTANITLSYFDARNYISKFNRLYPNISSYVDDYLKGCTSRGYVSGIFGRKLWVDENTPEHKLLNKVIQNSASDLTLMIQPKLAEELRGLATHRLFVHDEIVFECHKDNANKVIEIAKEYMVNKVKLRVPVSIDVGVGTSWAAKE